MENHHFYWENPLFLWPFSIAMLVHQRVPENCYFHGNMMTDQWIELNVRWDGYQDLPREWLKCSGYTVIQYIQIGFCLTKALL